MVFWSKSNKGPGLQAVCIGLILFLCFRAGAQVVISEILINPPGTDAPNEYIELRGAPNQVLAAGT